MEKRNIGFYEVFFKWVSRIKENRWVLVCADIVCKLSIIAMIASCFFVLKVLQVNVEIKACTMPPEILTILKSYLPWIFAAAATVFDKKPLSKLAGKFVACILALVYGATYGHAFLAGSLGSLWVIIPIGSIVFAMLQISLLELAKNILGYMKLHILISG